MKMGNLIENRLAIIEQHWITSRFIPFTNGEWSTMQAMSKSGYFPNKAGDLVGKT